MTLYMGTIILTELMMFAMVIHVRSHTGFSREQKRWYILTYSAIMVCAAAEFTALHFNSRGPAFVLPLTVLTVFQFSLTPFLPVLFAGALGMRREAKIAGWVFALNALTEIISVPFGWIFRFDANGTYIRGPLYILYEGFYLVSLLYLIVSLFVVGKRFRHRDLPTIIMVFVVMAAAILPLLLYKIYTDYLGIGLCACLCYIYYNDLIQEDTRSELISNQNQINNIQDRIISGLANLIENRDLETGEHVNRTSAYVRSIAENAQREGLYREELTNEYIQTLVKTAPLHDIGKIVVSDRILKKPGRLTPEEFETMKSHAAAGGRVVRDILTGITDEKYLSMAVDIATYHHERWDGTGYPEGLSGEEIPLAARIMALADVFDALVSERCYKKAVPEDEAFEIMKYESGTHFDPKLTDVFLRHREDIRRIRHS